MDLTSMTHVGSRKFFCCGHLRCPLLQLSNQSFIICIQSIDWNSFCTTRPGRSTDSGSSVNVILDFNLMRNSAYQLLCIWRKLPDSDCSSISLSNEKMKTLHLTGLLLPCGIIVPESELARTSAQISHPLLADAVRSAQLE